MIRLAVALVAALLFSGTGIGQDAEIKTVSYTVVVGGFGQQSLTVPATLAIPKGGNGKLPAVILVHGFGGVDGTSRAYAEALRKAGIATLEIEPFKRYLPVNLHPTVQELIPRLYGGLRFLSGNPQIDAARVGILGFSLGGAAAIAAASEEFAKRNGGASQRFAAHLALYPICWLHRAVADGTAENSGHIFFREHPEVYQRFTGVPVHILSAERDEFESPEACVQFLKLVSAAPGAAFKHTVVPGVSHGWDKPRRVASHSPLVGEGEGGSWEGVPDAQAAERSRRYAVEFFVGALKP